MVIKQLILRCGIVGLAAITVGLVGGGWLVGTPSGTKFSIVMAVRMLPGRSTVKRVQGSWLRAVTLQELQLNDPRYQIQFNQVTLKMDWRKLVHKKLPVAAIVADGGVVDLRSTSKLKASSAPSDSKLVFRQKLAMVQSWLVRGWALDELQITGLELRRNHQLEERFSQIFWKVQYPDLQTIQIRGAILSAHSAVTVQGEIGDDWRVDWSVKLPRLEVWIPAIRGTVISSGKIQGQRNMPVVVGELRLPKLAWDGGKCRQLVATFKIPASSRASNNTGTFSAKRMDSQLSGFTARRTRSENAECTSSVHEQCEQASNNAGNLRAKSMAWQLAVQELHSNLWSIQQLQGEGGLALAENQSWSGYWNGAPGRFHLRSASGQRREILLPQWKIWGNWNDEGLKVQAHWKLADFAPLEAKLHLPRFRRLVEWSDRQPMVGEVSWRSNQLSKLAQIISGVEDLRGKLKVQYHWQGRLDDLQCRGEITWEHGGLRLKGPNLALRDIRLHLQQQNRQLTGEGIVHSGEGRVNWRGSAKLAMGAIAGEVALDGENFLALNTQQYQVVVTPNLRLKFTPQRLDLTGDLVVPQATIKPIDFSSYELLPAELSYLQPAESALTITPHVDVMVVLGKEVELELLGLQGKVGGKLRLIDDPQKTTTAQGRIYVRKAHYLIYGQQLEVTRGELIFLGGALANPEINLVAERQFTAMMGGASWSKRTDQRLTVGIQVAGQLNEPKVTLFSSSDNLSHSDMLSYLITGQSAEKLSESKAQLLFQVASSLKLGGGDLSAFVDKLKNRLGLSELGLTEEAAVDHLASAPAGLPGSSRMATNSPNAVTTSTLFVLGRYLTPNVYISYGVRFLDQVSLFRIKYYLNRYFSLRGESSSTGSAALDLLCTLEQ